MIDLALLRDHTKLLSYAVGEAMMRDRHIYYVCLVLHWIVKNHVLLLINIILDKFSRV